MPTLTLCRPAVILSDETRLDREYRSTKWLHHRLLDFEAEHDELLDKVAEEIAPGIVKVNRILARLHKRARRASRTTKGRWAPKPRPKLLATLQKRMQELKTIRNADPRWKEALAWPNEEIGEAKQARRRKAKDPSKIKRRKNESDEAFQKRFDLFTTDETEEHFAEKVAKNRKDPRREVFRKDLYAKRHIYWGTWNALKESVDQARKAVLKERKKGKPASMNRPRYSSNTTIAAKGGGFRIVERGVGTRWVVTGQDSNGKAIYEEDKSGGPWWIVEMRIGFTPKDKSKPKGKGPKVKEEWVRFKVKGENWHAIPDEAKFIEARLTRRKNGEGWSYSFSLAIDMIKPVKEAPLALVPSGLVAFDWGHREHGHPNAKEGIRAFTWKGSDGASGEVLLPAKCRKAVDEVDAMKSRVDELFNVRKAAKGLPDKNRHAYRKRLMKSGVKTEEETNWLRWEMKYERRMMKRRKYVKNLRKQTYIQAIIKLRAKYETFVFEQEEIQSIRDLQTDEMRPRRQRSNRDLAAKYEFLELCKELGREGVMESAYNTTRECPEPGCNGLLPENGPDLIVVCPACGTARDKDYGAARVILERAQKTLAAKGATG